VRAARRIITGGSDPHQIDADLGVTPRLLDAWLRRYAVVSETGGGAWRLKTSAERVQ
jgi:hypothetical protein